MTVSNQTSKNVYIGDGGTLIFAYTFRIFADADLEVTIQDTSVDPQTEITLVLNTDYTVSGADNPTGGNVTLVLGGQLSAAPVATDNITIRRNLPFIQPTDYVENDPFPANSHEKELDRGAMIDQQIQEELDRTLKLSANITGVDVSLPTPLADAPIGWNSTATGLTNNPATTNLSQIDTGASPDFIGATGADGVLRISGLLSYVDGGDFITIGLTPADIDHDAILNYVALEHYPAIDEDTMVSDSDTQVPTQQSVKAYVDAQITSQNEFVELTDTPASYVGASLNFMRVNVGETAVEFIDPGLSILVRKGSGGTIVKGAPVYISGFAIGPDVPEIEEADASSAATMPAAGIANESIDNTANGEILAVGRVIGIKTDYATWAVGDELYISPTAGTLQNTRPTGTDLIQIIGRVLRVHATLGEIQVSGASRTNATPNLATNNVWVGDGSQVPTDSLLNYALLSSIDAATDVTAAELEELTDGSATTLHSHATVTITVEDEGTPLTTAVTKFNFAGAGVTVTEPVADEVLITIPGGGGGTTLDEAVAQATHGFSVNDWVYHNGTIYALADASASASAESIGIVSAVADVNNFTLQFGGKITGLAGLTAGEAHFLSETAGAITATAPTTNGAVVKPVLIADSTTTGFIFNMRGSEITDAASRVVSFVDGDLTAGVLTINHLFGNQYVQVQIFDNSDNLIIPDDVTLTDANNLDVDLTSYGTLTGTYHAVVLDSGATTNVAVANDLALTGQAAEDFAIFDGTNWVSKGGTEKVFTGSFSRDVSVASGTQAVSGLGFKPSYILFTASNAPAGMSVGHDNGTIQNCIFERTGTGTSDWSSSDSYSIIYDKATGDTYSGLIQSLDSDGFTITWTKAGAPIGTFQIKFTAYR